jgi:hypothetical protein
MCQFLCCIHLYYNQNIQVHVGFWVVFFFLRDTCKKQM